MNLISKKQLLFIGGALLGLVVVGFLFVFSIKDDQKVERVSLEVWGTEDNDSFEKAARAYMDKKTNVSVDYKEISEASFESRLMTALAAGKGPDIFFVESHSLPVDLISEAPQTAFTLERLRTSFPEVIEQDFAPGGKVLALPLYLDTLALVYNQNIYNRVGIVDPPKAWEEFEDIVSDLRVLDDSGRVVKAGAAIGGSDRSIENATDVLQMLMLQNGAQMISGESRNSPTFASQGDKGIAAFDYYTKFGNPAGSFYTWDDSGKKAMDSFASEESVMVFAYKSDIEELKAKNPFLKVGVAPVPQVNLEKPVTFASYHGMAVSKQSKKQDWAWDFIINFSTDPSIAKSYIAESKKPPALKSLISENLKSAEYGIFARQALVAESWFYSGHGKIKEALSQAIQKKISGAADSKTALQQAENRVREIILDLTKEE